MVRPIVFWGTFDLGKPRVRILRRAAESLWTNVLFCHIDVWRGVRDKSQMRRRATIALIGRLLAAYPILIIRYLCLPRHRAVIVPYLGALDVIVLWPFARLRGAHIYWDVYISLYDTAINDRKMWPAGSLVARMLKWGEWLVARLADQIFSDTETQARYFEQLHGLAIGSVGVVWVGVESAFFTPRTCRQIAGSSGPLRVLFYGQFIPLHGIEVIVGAAEYAKKHYSNRPIQWTIVGEGQEQAAIDLLLAELKLTSVKRIPWVPYEQLNDWIVAADICLGIFGRSEKALRVISNKVFQILAVGGPLITADSPALSELLPILPDNVRLIPPGDSRLLAESVIELADTLRRTPSLAISSSIPLLDYRRIAEQLAVLLQPDKPATSSNRMATDVHRNGRPLGTALE